MKYIKKYITGDILRLSDWYNKIVLKNALKYENKINNYRFTLLSDSNNEFTELYKLREAGVWLIQDNDNSILDIKKGIRIIIGFHPIHLHLGHLSLIKELSLYASYDAEFVFIVANHEKNNVSKQIIEDFWGIMGNTCNLSNCSRKVFWDDDFLELMKLTDQISKNFTINKVLQIFGWDNSVSLHIVRNVLIVASSFLISNIMENKNTIVLLDINQMPFFELCRLAAKKNNLSLPSFAFIRLFPSICNVNKRMSIKDAKSTIFLDESDYNIEKKLKSTFTCGSYESNNTECKLLNCCFFRVMELFFDYNQLEKVLKDCENNTKFCSECKKNNIPIIMGRIKKLKRGIYD